MKQAKIFSIAVMLAVLSYGAVGFYFLPQASFQGDLTRMAMLPESEFGWRQPQAAIDKKLFVQSAMQDADVLVIGDSFSDSRVWQTMLTQNGLKVRTEHWDSVRAICTDFMPWLRAQGFHGRFVVLQIIERNIEDGLKKSVACQHMQTHPNASADRLRHPPITSFDLSRVDRTGRLSVGIQTALNISKYRQIASAPDFNAAILSNGARVARIKNGCELFSHVRCGDALFLAEDKAKDLDAGMLDNIEQLNARMSGITPFWAFVPNKSTAYLYPNKKFWDDAERRFQAPNLLRMTQRALQDRTVDLYPANNTHFSTTGYLLMGEEILKAIQQPREIVGRASARQMPATGKHIGLKTDPH